MRIVLTGAGTSAFAGEALVPWLQKENRFNVEAVATTDIVSNPEQYLDPAQPTLVVSFARSGNSPESVAAVELADQLVLGCYHLFLTCNPQGELAKLAAQRANACCLLMPELSNDKSFAMTSSFTCMTMAALGLLSATDFQELALTVKVLAKQCESKIEQWQKITKELASLPYKRLVYLGSGGFTGLAREAALKSLELSAGQLTTMHDSSLGFRHGPKFFINNETMVIQFLSADSHTRLYDVDLYKEIQNDKMAMKLVALSETGFGGEGTVEVGTTGLSEAWLFFPYILFAQMLAFEKSLQLGLTPDNPCPTGEVNRVVQGVHIHAYQA